MAETRTYALNEEFSLDALSGALEQFLKNEKNLRTQRLDSQERAILQCAGDDAQWKKFLGMDAAVTVDMKAENDILTVTVGNAKWLDKMGVAAVGAIFFSPLLLTAGIGALRQSTLPAEIFDRIEGMLLNRSMQYDTSNVFVCPDCGRKLRVEDVFCPGCGRKL